MATISLSKEKVLAEFQEWLIDNNGKTRASSNLYKGYVKKFFHLYPELVITQSKEFVCETLLIEYDGQLSDMITEAADKNKKKALSNIRSGFRSFSIFLEEVGYSIELNNPQAEDVSSSKNNKHEISYSQKELVSIFRSRLNTQDRVFEKIALPFRLINMILNKSSVSSEYNKFMNKEILAIQFLTNNGVKTLGDIEGLFIESSGLVSVLDKHPYSKSTAFSYVYSKGSEFLVADSMSVISLDHNVPLFSIVQELNEDEHSELFRLSSLVRSYFTVKKVNLNAQLSNAGFSLPQPQDSFSISVADTRRMLSAKNKGVTKDLYAAVVDKVDASKLLSDLKKLYQKIDLVVMHRNDNSIKNKY